MGEWRDYVFCSRSLNFWGFYLIKNCKLISCVHPPTPHQLHGLEITLLREQKLVTFTLICSILFWVLHEYIIEKNYYELWFLSVQSSTCFFVFFTVHHAIAYKGDKRLQQHHDCPRFAVYQWWESQRATQNALWS